MTEDYNNLKHISNAFDPEKFAEGNTYVDCSKSRGSVGLLDRTVRSLDALELPQHLLFSGHIGCGKTSELHALGKKLADIKTPVGKKKFFILHFRALDYLNRYDTGAFDIVWSIVSELSSQLKVRENITIADSYFERRWKEIKHFFVSTNVQPTEFKLAGIKTNLKFNSGNRQLLQELRTKERPEEITMLQQLNVLLGKATIALNKKGYERIVLILDDLDKIKKFEKMDEGTSSYKELYIERHELFTSLDVHVVATIPLTIARTHGPQLANLYSSRPVVLPMIKVTERDGVTPHQPGCEDLKEVIKRRLGNIPLQEAFTEDALKALLHFSGGHMRQLMQLIRDSSLVASALPIRLEDVHSSLASYLALYDGAMPARLVSYLTELYESETKFFDVEHPDSIAMLEQHLVMEYVNGSQTSSHTIPWYIPHPIVRLLPRFLASLNQQIEPATSEVMALSEAPSSTLEETNDNGLPRLLTDTPSARVGTD